MAVFPAGESITTEEIKDAYTYFKNYFFSFFEKKDTKAYTI